jgi:gliding motility-associated-like protein
VTLPNDITLYCGTNQTQLQGQVTNPVSPFSVQWKTDTGAILDEDTKLDIIIQGEGLYTVEVTYNDSGCKTTEAIKVQVDTNYPRAILAEITDETCLGKKDGAISVQNITGGLSPYTYALNGTVFSNNAEFAPLVPGDYTLVIKDANGCTKDSTFVINEGSDITLSTISPIEIIYNQSQTLEVKTNLSDAEIKSVKWTPADQLSCDECLITTIQPIEDKRYEVLVTDIYGCEARATVVIRVKDNSMVSVPNVINPNGSSNKNFVIYGNENVFNVESLSIYDRWGNLMFTKQNFKPNSVEEGWDGSFGGKQVAPGVYVYKVDYLTPSGLKTITGDVTVL